MVLLFLLVGIILIVVGAILQHRYNKKDRFASGEERAYIYGPGIIVALIAILGAIILSGLIIEAKYLDERIEMYEQENTAIEEQIASLVNDYKEYEQGIFDDISPKEAMTVVVLYPELKANTLVSEQMRIHTSNNEKIKELKEAAISAKQYKWWLYFGG